MTESFAELFEQSQSLSKLKPGSIVTGVVVDIRSDVVVVHAGLKSEGIVPIEQFKNENGELEVAIGDEVVLMGTSGDQRIGVEELAQVMGTITYEVTCLIAERVERTY